MMPGVAAPVEVGKAALAAMAMGTTPNSAITPAVRAAASGKMDWLYALE